MAARISIAAPTDGEDNKSEDHSVLLEEAEPPKTSQTSGQKTPESSGARGYLTARPQTTKICIFWHPILERVYSSLKFQCNRKYHLPIFTEKCL